MKMIQAILDFFSKASIRKELEIEIRKALNAGNSEKSLKEYAKIFQHASSSKIRARMLFDIANNTFVNEHYSILSIIMHDLRLCIISEFSEKEYSDDMHNLFFHQYGRQLDSTRHFNLVQAYNLLSSMSEHELAVYLSRAYAP